MKITNKEVIKHELPAEIDGIKVRGNEVLMPLTFKCVISGINTAQMNAIRRTALDELDVQALELVHFESTDPYLVSEMISDRVAEIPIKQQAKIDKNMPIDRDIYKIGPLKNGDKYKDISTSLFTYTDKNKAEHPVKDLCNRFTILYLSPNTSLNMHMKVVVKKGYERAQHSYVSRFIISTVENVNQQTEYIKAKEHNVEFDLKGNVEPEELIKLCIDNIKNRLSYIITILPNIITRNDKKGKITFDVPNETYTIANILYTEIIKKEYGTTSCSFKVNHDIRNFKLKLTFDDAPNDQEIVKLVTSAINKIMADYD